MLLYTYAITCRDSLDRECHYVTQAVDDDHAQTRFFNDRETQPGKYGDWQPDVTTLIQARKNINQTKRCTSRPGSRAQPHGWLRHQIFSTTRDFVKKLFGY